MKILVCGMPRSMTTWTFNVLRLLISSKDMSTIWIPPNSENAEINFATYTGDVIGKCHHFSLQLAESADLLSFQKVKP